MSSNDPYFKAFDPVLLDSFCQLVEQNNLTRAAETLEVTQPALSKRMRKLQEILKLPLIETFPSRIGVTPVGHAFYQQAKILKDYYREQWDTLRSQTHLSLSVEHELLAYVLDEAIQKFAFSTTRLLRLKTGVSRDNIRDVSSGESALAIVIPDDSIGTEVLATPLAAVRFKAIFSPDHRLAARTTVEALDFNGETLIVPPIQEISRRRLEQFFADAGISFQVAGESVLYPVSLQLVAALHSIAIVPEYCPVPPMLTSRPIPSYPSLPYLLIEHKVRHPNRELQYFKQLIIQAFAGAAPRVHRLPSSAMASPS